MNNFKMTRLVLAILALVGFTGAQAAISAADLQNSSVFQNTYGGNQPSSTGVGSQPVMSSQMNAQEAWPATPTVPTNDPTQPWKDWIDGNPGVDVSQQDGFGDFSGDQQQDLLNYQNASQGGSQSGMQTGGVQTAPADEGYGSDDDWDDDDGELQGQTSTEPDLTQAELQQWKDWITEHKVTVAQLESEANFQSLNSSDQTILKLYVGMQAGSGVSGYPTTASTTTTTTAASVDPQEQALVTQWIDYYIKEQGYTAAQVQGITGFKDFSAAAQQQLINAASGGSSKWNTATQYGGKVGGYAQQGANWAANTQVGKETGQIANTVYRGMKKDFEDGADQAARGLLNWGLKKMGLNVQLPAQATPQTAGVQPIPGAQTGPGNYGQPQYYNPQTGQVVVEQGPQPQNYGPNTPGTLYQGQTNSGQTNNTGRTAPPPPPPGGKRVPVQPGMPTVPTTQEVSNSVFNTPGNVPASTPTVPVASASDSGIVPDPNVSLPGLPFPNQQGQNWLNLTAEQKKWVPGYGSLVRQLAKNPSKVNLEASPVWSEIPDTGQYSKQALINYQAAHRQ